MTLLTGTSSNPAALAIRKMTLEDVDTVARLFYGTVHHVNRQDYTLAQCDAWAPDLAITPPYFFDLLKNDAYVAVIGDKIVGFADLTDKQLLNCLYVHHHHQRQGIGLALLNRIEQQAQQKGYCALFTEASITALPFFMAHGWTALSQQQVICQNEVLTNYRMRKDLPRHA